MPQSFAEMDVLPQRHIQTASSASEEEAQYRRRAHATWEVQRRTARPRGFNPEEATLASRILAGNTPRGKSFIYVLPKDGLVLLSSFMVIVREQESNVPEMGREE